MVSMASSCCEESSQCVGLSLRVGDRFGARGGAAGEVGGGSQGPRVGESGACGVPRGCIWRSHRRSRLWVAKAQECSGSASGFELLRGHPVEGKVGRKDILNSKMVG